MAINVQRAQRRTEDYLVPKAQTAEHVAPGTYANTHNKPDNSLGEGIVPFFSLQEKVLNPNKGASAYTPGPGAYIGPEVRNGTGTKANGDNSLGVSSTSLKSRSKRMAPTAPGSSVYMASSIEKNPGPGTYKTEADSLATKVPKDLLNPSKPVLEALEKTTPSMPPQKLGPGQKPETDTGGVGDVSHLYMRHTGEQSDMVGPGEYDPRGEHITQRTMPQTIFHNSRSQRNLFEASVAAGGVVPPKDTPGPGSYEIKSNLPEKDPVDSLTEVVNSYQFASQSPMAHQTILSPDKVSPGPGQYELQAEIDRTVQSARERMGPNERTNFGGMSARVGWARDPSHPYKDPYHVHHVPGPGHYAKKGADYPTDPKKKEVDKVVPGSRKKKFHGVHHPSLIMALQEATGPLQAFNSTDDRPCNKEKDQKTPAPWQYNGEEARAHSMQADLRERAKVGRKGVFGTRADRFFGSPLDGRPGNPDALGFEDKGPGNNAEPRSMFQSGSPRFHSTAGPREANATRVGNTETPAPGDYLVEREPNYRSPYRTPRKDHLSFGSSKQRFEGSKDVFAEHMPGMPNPGPGEYVGGARRRVVGGADMKDKRKPPVVGCTSTTVGPGSYGDDVSTHMLRKTFNVSTQVPMGASTAKPPISTFSF